jgi:hypothetical protein
MNDPVLDQEEPEQMECYEFNTSLLEKFNDGMCEHCRKYLTILCPHIDMFIGEEEFDEEF